MLLPNPWVILGALIVYLVSVGGTYIYAQHRQSTYDNQQQTLAIQAAKIQGANEQLAQDKKTMSVEIKYVDKIVYRYRNRPAVHDLIDRACGVRDDSAPASGPAVPAAPGEPAAAPASDESYTRDDLKSDVDAGISNSDQLEALIEAVRANSPPGVNGNDP